MSLVAVFEFSTPWSIMESTESDNAFICVGVTKKSGGGNFSIDREQGINPWK